MRRRWMVWSVVLPVALSGSLWAQDSAPDQTRVAQQQRLQQYTQVEYQRCRNDLAELWVKGDMAEQRVKELEETVRKLTEELIALRSASHEAKPAN